MKTRKTLFKRGIVLAVLLLCFSVTFSLFSPVQAVSATTTGLTLNSFDRNQGKHATCGGYEIYAFDNKLVFYDSSANLVKTWNVPNGLPSSVSYDALTNTSAVITGDISLCIAKLDESHVIIAKSFLGTFTNGASYGANGTIIHNTFLVYFVLDVNTLGSTGNWAQFYRPTGAFFGDNSGTTIQPQGADLILFEMANKFYVVFGSKQALDFSKNDCYNAEIYPSFTPGTTLTGSNQGLYSSSLVVVSADNSTAYFLTCNNIGGNQAYLYSFDGTVMSYVGVTGLANTYGGSWVCFGASLEHDLTGTNHVFDVLVSFGYLDGSTQMLTTELFRFNATSFSVEASLSSSVTTKGTVLRVLGLGSVDLTGLDALADATYIAIYYNSDGALKDYGVTLAGLNTASPSLTGSGLGSFQGLVFMFGGATSVGGLVDTFSTVALMVDYTGGRCAAELVTPLSSTINYDYSWVPAPLYNTATLVQLAGGSTYIYTGHIDVNGVNGQGSVDVRINGTSSASALSLKILDGNGNFTLTFVTPFQTTDLIYRINMTLTNFNVVYSIVLEVLTTSVAQTPSPTSIGGGGGWGTSPIPGGLGGGGGAGFISDSSITPIIGSFVNFMLLFIFVAAPAIGLGYKLGLPGMLGGGMFGLAAGVLIGRVPPWFIFVTATGLVLSFLMWRNGQNGK